MVRASSKRGDYRMCEKASWLKKFIAAIAGVALMLAFHGTATASDALQVKAEGLATRFEDKSDVKKRAIDRALTEAVANAITALETDGALSQTPDELKKQAASNAQVYVLDYKILAEGWLTHLDMAPPLPIDEMAAGEAALAPGVQVFHIRLEASIDAAKLKKALLAVGKNASAQAERIMFVLLDMSVYADHKEVMSALEKTAQIKDLTYVSFYRGKTVLTGNSTIDEHALAVQLARDLQERYAVVSGASGVIVIKPQTSSRKGAQQ